MKNIKHERGYVIHTTGYQRNGTFYKDGYLGDGFYKPITDCTIIRRKDEAKQYLKHCRKEYDDGTVIFKLYKASLKIETTLEEITEE